MKQILLFVTFIPTVIFAKCVGKFPNPITDVCWNCMFPLKIAGANFKADEGKYIDIKKYDQEKLSNLLKKYQSIEQSKGEGEKKYICKCSSLLNVGIPLGFFEPVRLVDVTHIPWCLVGLNGISLNSNGKSIGVQNKDGAFYHVHWYVFPVMYLVQIFGDFQCLDKGKFDLAYLSEFDPTWSNDAKAMILNPEALLFANPVAIASCAVDAVSASLKRPIDSMFWCSGAHGSIYPFTGTTAHFNGAVGNAALLVGKTIAKFHRMLLLPGTSGERGLCQKYLQPVIKKSQYQYQMLYPVAENHSCKKIGQTEFFWQSGKTYPVEGEDFCFLVWRKRDCCATLQRTITGTR